MKIEIRYRKWILALTSIVAMGIIALSTLLLNVGVRVSPSTGSLSLSINKVRAADTIIGELTDNRTESSKTYYLGSGRYSIDSYIGPVHYKDDYQDDKAPWLDIDTTIINGSVTKAPYDLQVYLTGTPGFTITSKQIGAYEVRLGEARVSDIDATRVNPDISVRPSVLGNTVTWPEYYPGIDIVLTAGSGGVSLQRLIKSPDTAKEFDVTITEIQKGVLTLQPLQPAVDAMGQQILMEEKPIIGGRTETLKLEVLSPDAKSISYPILDAIDVQVGASGDDGHRYTGSTGFVSNATSSGIGYINNAAYYHMHTFHRWDNISISGTIDVAYIQVFVTDIQNGGALTKVHVVMEDDAAAPTSAAEFDADSLSTGVDWDGAWTDEAWNQSSSLITEFQDLVDTYTISNDAVMVQVKNDAGTNARYCVIRTWDYTGNAHGAQLHIEFTPAGGEPSLANTPASINLGTLWMERTYYAKGTAPNNPVVDGDCTFTITNDGDITCNVTASMTDMTGGTSWNLVSSSPGADEFRMTAYYTGQNPNSGLVLTNSAQAFYNGLTASSTIKWDFKYETGTWTDTTAKTGTLTLTAIEP